jgi:hypothetical protein
MALSECHNILHTFFGVHFLIYFPLLVVAAVELAVESAVELALQFWGMEEQKVVPLRGDEACNKMRQHEQ